MKQTLVNVQGMTCGHCVKAVESNVGNMVGVSAVKVHLDNGEVDITFDETKISLEQIKDEIEEQGYDV